jgi:hypothetical protein
MRASCAFSYVGIMKQHIIGPSHFPMSSTEWGGVGMAGVDLGFCNAMPSSLVLYSKNEKRGLFLD